MSELINKHDNRATIRWKLLTSVSAAALVLSAYGAGEALAADANRPLIWIELGGQFEQLSDSQESLSPSFMASITQASLLKALDVQKPSGSLIGDSAKLTFQPEDSDWAFSASIQYGRAGGKRHHHQQTANKTIPVYFTLKYHPIGPKYLYPSRFNKFTDGQSDQSQENMILDFQAGKDVGLGLFGGRGSSVLSAGVRIAQFTSKSDVTLRADPDVQYPTAPVTNKYEWIALRNNHARFHNYAATASSNRSFQGLGPSLAWNASVPVAGNEKDGEITVDWGMNASMLFGRQKTRGHHRTVTKAYYFTSLPTNGFYHFQKSGKDVTQVHAQNPSHQTENGIPLPTAQNTNAPPAFDRSRNVTVPNLGGFAGLSVRYSDVKFSIGYKADFFFNAIDGGIDTRKTENRGFFGPYANISIGIGD